MAVKQFAKRLLSVLLALSLVMGSVMLIKQSEAQASQTNLILNGAFDTTDGWENTSVEPATAVTEQGTEQVFETIYLLNEDFSEQAYSSYVTAYGTGSALTVENGALKVTGNANSNGVQAWLVPVTAGQTYTVSYKVKIDTNGMQTNTFLQSWNRQSASGTYDSKYMNHTAKNGICDWTEVSFEYTVPEAKTGNVLQCAIYNNLSTADYIFWIDDFSISYKKAKVKEDRTEYAVNGDMEEDVVLTNNWGIPQAAVVTYAQGEGVDGSRALSYTREESTTTVPALFYTTTTPVFEEGVTYTVSFDARSTSSLTWRCYVDGIGSGGTDWQIWDKDMKGTTTWDTYTYTFTPTKTKAYTQLGFQLFSAGTLYIDNFSVYTAQSSQVYTYTEGIGNCGNEEPDNVLVMKEMTKVSYHVSLVSGKEYTYSYKFKTDGTADVTFLAGTQAVKEGSSAEEWNMVTGTFTAEDNFTKVNFERTGDGKVFLDDVVIAEKETVEPLTTTISKRYFGAQDEAYQLTLNVSNVDELVTEYGNWSWFEGEILVDGTATKVRFNLGSGVFSSFKTNQNPTAVIPLDATFIKIPEGTIFTDVDGSSSRQLKTANDFAMTKVGNSWIDGEEKGPLTTAISKKYIGAQTEAYQLTLNVSNIDELVTEYGNWSWFEGEILVNGTATKVQFNLGSGVFSSFKTNQNPTAVIPLDATLIKIPAGTIFTDVDGSSARQLKTENDFAVSKVNGAWIDGEVTEVEPITTTISKKYFEAQTEAYQLTLNVSNIDELVTEYGNWSWFEGEILVNGTATKVRFNLGSGVFSSFQTNQNPTAVIPLDATAIVIPKGTEFIDVDGSSAKALVIQNELKLTKINGAWYEGDAKPAKPKKYSTTITLNRIASDGIIVRHDGTVTEHFNNYTYFTGTIKINGTKQEVRWQLSNASLAIWSITDSSKLKKVEIEAGTKLTNDNGDVLTLKNGLKYVKAHGEWWKNSAPSKFNDVKITFEAFDGQAFYMKAEIVSGPDKGKIIGTEAYGNWMSGSFGTAYYNRTEKVQVAYSPVKDTLYVSGFPDLSTIDSITLKKGTILIPKEDAWNSTPMRLANTVELAKEDTYGRWGVKGKIKTPTKFNEVYIYIEKINPTSLTLVAQFADGTKKTLTEIYGENTSLYGAAEIVHPDDGAYTNGNAAYQLLPTGKMSLGIDLVYLDSVDVKKGTILWPTASCDSQIPVRIMNNAGIDRDVEDEWYVRTGSAAGKDVTSPKTGDVTPFDRYLFMIAIALGGIGICVIEMRKRKRKNIK